MKSIIAWFIDNRVATNLLMLILVVGGIMALPNIYREEFPNIEIDAISVRVPYPGAVPEEVEQTVCVRVEEAIEGSVGVKKISTTASDGLCSITAELIRGYDKGKALSDIKGKVDAIDTFPEESELPITSEVNILTNVLQVVMSGPADEASLKELGEDMRNQLLDIGTISQVTLKYVRPYEIAIEISEDTLRRYGLNLQQVADAVRANSIDLPGGGIKTDDGEILLRTLTQAETTESYEQIVVLTRPDGTNVSLGELGNVVDGFQDSELRASFNGNPAIVIDVKRIDSEDALDVAAAVKDFVAVHSQRLPDGIELLVWMDESQDLVDRLEVMGKNARSGLLLVLLVLALFMRLRLAFWVAAGIPISLLGMLMTFPWLGMSISTLSVMGVVLVLGILVDDAIVVGERIYAHQQMGKDPRQAAIDGTYEVSVPVIFGVLTTIMAFTPLMLMKSGMGPFFAGVGTTAVIALIFSVIESQLILPMHLSHVSQERKQNKSLAVAVLWERFQDRFSGWLDHVISDYYEPVLNKALNWRYTCTALAVACIFVVVGMMASGRIVFQFFPAVDGSRLYANLTMPEGTPVDTTERAINQILAAAYQLREEMDGEKSPAEASLFGHVMTSIGAKFDKNSIPVEGGLGAHVAEVAVELNLPADYDGTTPGQYASRWRELTGAVADAVELSFDASALGAGEDINIQFRGDDLEQLKQAATMLRQDLATYPGVHDISDTFRSGKQEMRLGLLPEARNLGLTSTDLARQVRQAFYGEEVQRLQRGREDIKVMVRYPEAQRRSLGDLEDMRIRTGDGAEVPFASVASVELGAGYSDISRVDGKRVISVIAKVDRSITSPEVVRAGLVRTSLPVISQRFPELNYAQAGEAEESADSLAELVSGAVLAGIVIYALLAIPLQSYAQPFIIMSVIPFGAMGAIFGHYLMGWDLVFFSLLGIVALAGVVINASLVMVDYINRQRRQGVSLRKAILITGRARFRPIVLTSTTTFVGLFPLISMTSLATGVFVPMAISLAFGVLFSTAITLFLVPCFYLILEDVKDRLLLRRQQIRKSVKRAWKQEGWPG